jgi:hypothetical protein
MDSLPFDYFYESGMLLGCDTTVGLVLIAETTDNSLGNVRQIPMLISVSNTQSIKAMSYSPSMNLFA